MIVQVFAMYAFDCCSDDYEEGKQNRVRKEAASASYAILDGPDQDPEDAERQGELSPGGEYVFRDGRLMGRVGGRWMDWETKEF